MSSNTLNIYRNNGAIGALLDEYERAIKDLKDVLKTIKPAELTTIVDNKTFEADKKILVRWGQLYDVEQLFEHAIVHILRHRRQIERFLLILR